MAIPAHPKIYHIVNVDRLASIIGDGCLWSDAVMIGHAGPGTIIGMSKIKERRLRLPVGCHAGTHVGDYVPFYFCPRSIMLYVIYKGNHPDLDYMDGQGPIVHLEADLHSVVAWADRKGRRWAFSLSNAGGFYTEFRCDLADLGEVDWTAVEARNWANLRDGKQAEFLMHGSFPWELVSRIGVHSRAVAQQVADALRAARHRPAVEIRPDWYY